jgi:uncharacterized membrane protein
MREPAGRRWLAHHLTKDAENSLQRIIFFSDAVFAIAITLLVLDIRVPSVPQDLAAIEQPQAIAALWPKFLSYICAIACGYHTKGTRRLVRF